MEELLQEIKTLPNIMGSFVFVEGLGIAATDLPRLLCSKDLDKFGNSINRIFTLNQTSDVDVINIEIEYDEAKIFSKPINDGSTLLVIGEPAANLALVKMTSSMLTAEFKLAVETAKLASLLPETSDANLDDLLLPTDPETISLPLETAKIAIPAKPVEPPPAEKTAIDPVTLFQIGPLAAPLARIEDALAKAIGPFAKIIMRENIELWVKNGEATKERLQELTELLIIEIGNSKLESQFRNEIKSLLA
jgi:predicted regulator of Ras-like GTPase activity (Roadblock/LC7/MglB family)